MTGLSPQRLQQMGRQEGYREPTDGDRLIANVIGFLAMLTYCGIVLSFSLATR